MGKDPNMSGNSRRWILTECDNSLRRLGTDWIDLYQIHRPDPTVDIEETLGALTDLQRAGKIRAFGCSTFPAHEVVESQWVAERRGLGRFVTEQPPYSLLARGIEADLLPVCARYGMGVIPWSPLAGGWLSGRFGTGKDNTSRRSAMLKDRFDVEQPDNVRKLQAVDALQAVADEAGITLVELSVAWVLEHPTVTAPIIGPRTMEQLESQLGVPDVHLGTDVLDRIDEIVPPGSTVNPADAGWVPPSLTDLRARRRSA
jgi:aryl-alcohol dehydrogenase-like predicted oxidoreductase